MVHWDLDVVWVRREVAMLSVVWLGIWVVIEEGGLSHGLGHGLVG